jgi:carboxyl-terminal processing protease
LTTITKFNTFSKLTISRLLCSLIFSLLFVAVYAEIPSVSESSLVPAERHQRATEIITHIIESYHYKKKPLDDALSSAIFDRYLESLDPNKSYFLAGDIKTFEKYRNQLDDALKKQDLTPAFEIFKTYRKRVDERVTFSVNLLKDNFSFDEDENYIFDRRDLPWPATEAEMNDIWRQRIKNDILNLKLANKKQDEYTSTLQKRYERIHTSTYQLDANDVFQTFINAYTTSIEPHTAYFSPRTSENFDISMRLSLEGIGAVLTSDNDYTVIQQIIPGGPADLSKQLQKDDKIIGVAQGETGELVDVIGWRLDDVVDLIRGPKDTVLRLEILPKDTGPEGPHRVITLTRNKIKLEDQAAKSSILEPDDDSRIGVIKLPTFYVDFAAQTRGDKDYKSTTRDVLKLIRDLQKDNIDGLVIDLRGNGGGSLSEALELTGLFIEEGPIVQTKDSSGRVEINYDPNPGIVYTGPLAVLVDRNSASASEIFAGAIQDYQRGIVIGEPTFGKGTVQNIVDLNRFVRNSEDDHGRLKTTIAQFFRISGGSNQFKGVVPDIIFPTAKDASKYGERSLDNALPWDQVKPATYVKVNAPVDKFSLAHDRHKTRIKSDRAFQLLLEERNIIEEANERKSLSLLKSKREEERDQLAQTKRNLQNELRLAQGLQPLPENTDIEEIDAVSEETDDMKFDVLLIETANILYDLIHGGRINPRELQAIQQDKPEALNNL